MIFHVDFEEALTCFICSSRLVDPRILPCGQTACHECIQSLTTKNKFGCKKCGSNHEIPSKSGFPSNLMASKLISNVNLKDQASSHHDGKLQKLVKNIESGVAELKKWTHNPSEKIAEHVLKLKEKIDATTEREILKFKTRRDELNDQIAEYEKKRMDALRTTASGRDEIFEASKRLIENNERLCKKWYAQLNEPHEKQTTELRIDEYAKQLDLIEGMKNQLGGMIFNNEILRFVERNADDDSSIIGDLTLKPLINNNDDQETHTKSISPSADLAIEVKKFNVELGDFKTIRLDSVFKKSPDWGRLVSIDYFPKGHYVATLLGESHLCAFVCRGSHMLACQTRFLSNVKYVQTATCRNMVVFATVAIKDDRKTKETCLRLVKFKNLEIVAKKIIVGDGYDEYVCADNDFVYVMADVMTDEQNPSEKIVHAYSHTNLTRVFSISLQFNMGGVVHYTDFMTILQPKLVCVRDGFCYLLDSSRVLWKGSVDSGVMNKIVQFEDEKHSCGSSFFPSFLILHERIYVLESSSSNGEISSGNGVCLAVYDSDDGRRVKSFRLRFETRVDTILLSSDMRLAFYDSRNAVIYQMNDLIKD